MNVGGMLVSIAVKNKTKENKAHKQNQEKTSSVGKGAYC